MKTCPQCDKTYDDLFEICPDDGSRLQSSAPASRSNLLDNRYELVEKIGEGGMGSIYKAIHTEMGRTCAIKLLTAITKGNEEASARFKREAKMASRIDNRHAVMIYDFGETDDGTLFLAMEFIDGQQLTKIIKDKKTLPLETVVHITNQIAEGLAAAHQMGIIHRDLKPDNIMITRKGGDEYYIKVLDFGIAKTVADDLGDNLTKTGFVLGTPFYMSPEQLMGEKLDPRSDIYSLAIIVYEMLSGRLPFEADNPQAIMMKRIMGEPVPLREAAPFLNPEVERVVMAALTREPEARTSTVEEFAFALANAEQGATQMISSRSTGKIPEGKQTDAPTITIDNTGLKAIRVALLYKRYANPDEQLLKLLEAKLTEGGCDVFIDRRMSIGMEWAKEIEQQIRSADAVIPLLSAASIGSEMIAYEVQVAHEEAQKGRGKPRLLPVRVAYEGPLPDELGSILNSIQYALWDGPDDSDRLAADLLDSLQNPNGHKPPCETLEAVGGAVLLDSKFYVVRPTDEEFHAALARGDSIVLVKGARQMGKTSLLARGLQRARQAGARVVLTDFQKLNAAHLESIDSLFRTLAELIADQLDLDILPEDVWNPRRGPSMNFERFIRREVLGKISTRLVWGLDEVDRLFTCDYGSEVFGLFRSWHNERSLDPTGPWQRLSLAIAYATEAHLFITDLNQSPFNVGTRLTLEDFTLDQTAELNRRYGSPLRDGQELARYYHLVGGQPYLVQRGLNEMVTRGTELIAFENLADRDEGPFGDHLRRFLVFLAQNAALSDVVRGVLQGKPCPTNESFYRLRSAGLISGDSQRDARLRCELYQNYLTRHLLSADQERRQEVFN